MSLFLISFLSIYTAMHGYVFYRLRGAFLPGRTAVLMLAVWLLFMILAPVLVRLSEHAGLERCALLIAWLGYVWMGFIFIFISTLVLFDTLRGACWLTEQLCSPAQSVFPGARISCFLALLLACAASAYACYEARSIRSERVLISSPKLPPGSPKIRVVQISDLHIGLLFQKERLERVLKVIREAQPDMIVSTGDLVDGKLNREDILSYQDGLAAMLAGLPAPAGKYAVTGNHEAYAGLQQALAFTSAAGFRMLRNQSAALPGGMIISGVDDQVLLGTADDAQRTEKGVLDSVSGDTFRILLKHRPEIPAASDGRFDLQLSGHVHNGQIFPFNVLVRQRYPLPCGTTITGAGSRIHVSRGTGTWGPPMRLFAPPEVTVIDIVPAQP